MKYMRLNRNEQRDFLADLEAMPEYITDVFESLSPASITTAGPDGGFSPVEHVWHLADLEREGFSLRINRLKAEPHPPLPDFAGGELAAQRNYKSLSMQEGINAFRKARRDNVSRLRSLDAQQWLRQGQQDGVGLVSLCDMPALMAEHDQAHRDEIANWLNSNRHLN